MSARAIFDFLGKVANDDALRAELAERVAATDGDEAAKASGVAELAGERGFQFDPAEFTAVRRELVKIREGTLDDEELDRVAGGVGVLLPAVQTFNELPAVQQQGIIAVLVGL